MGMILHDWNLEKKLHLIRAAYDALPTGGALVVVENLIDDARRENAFGLMMSLNILIEFGEAFLAALECEELSVIVAKVAAVGPEHYGMDLQLPENAFRFRRWIQTRKRGRSA